MSERKWTPEEEEMIAKGIMSPYGKQKLREIIQNAGATFADISPPGSLGETLGRMVAGLPLRIKLPPDDEGGGPVIRQQEKELYNGN